MNRRFRLTQNEAVNRVRQEGHSFVHEAIVLGTLQNQLDQNRIAVIAGRSVGGAVQRNLAKRRIRSILRELLPEMEEGFDLVAIARKPILQKDYAGLEQIIRKLLDQAGVTKDISS